MRSRILCTLCLFLVPIPVESRADSFTVRGENTNWVHEPGDSLQYLIGIENLSSSSALLLLWDLNLTIRPASTQTTGNLFIVNAYQPSQNYLLKGRTDGIAPPFSGPANSIDLIGDVDNQYVGVPVPNIGKYLLELDLQASDNAQGQFNIEVQPQTSTSYWQTLDDIFSEPPNIRAFDNLPFESSSPITIGIIMVQSVPEPSSIAILSAGVAIISVLRLRLVRKNEEAIGNSFLPDNKLPNETQGIS